MPSSVTGVQTCALRSEEHTSELQSHDNLVCPLLLEKKNRSRRVVSRRSGSERLVPLRRGCRRRRAAPALSRPPARLRWRRCTCRLHGFFFNDTATTEIYTLSLHDALPI